MFASLEDTEERDRHIPTLVPAARKIRKAKITRENVGGTCKAYEKIPKFPDSEKCRNINISEFGAFSASPHNSSPHDNSATSSSDLALKLAATLDQPVRGYSQVGNKKARATPRWNAT